MSACINPMSVLITKEGDMGENSTSNDATRQWRQFAGSCCKLWSHVWNKDPLTFEIDGLFELRSMLLAKKKEDTTLKIFFLLFFFKQLLSAWYVPAKQTRLNWIFFLLHFLFCKQFLYRLWAELLSGHKISALLFDFFSSHFPRFQRSCVYMMDLQYWLNNFYIAWICKYLLKR